MDKKDTASEEDNNEKPPWSQLLPELVSMICQRLCPNDVPCFVAVCKHWYSCAFRVYPADSTPILISNTISDSGLVGCYSPYYNKMFVVRSPLRAPESRIFSAAANGWVILRGPDKTVLFGSLLDGSTFETTESKYDEGYFCASHEDGTEHLEQCGIFGFYATPYTTRVQSWNGESWKYFGEPLAYNENSDESDYGSGSDSDSGSDSNPGHGSGSDSDSEIDDDEEDTDEDEEEDGTNEYEEEEDTKEDEEEADMELRLELDEEEEHNEVREFTMSCCSPVLHKGLWYCLGEGGSLGEYDPDRNSWSVLPRPTSFGSEFPHKNSYLVESDQELLAVLTGKNGTPIHVLKLKEKEMTWERMDSLGSRAIFTGTLASLSMSNPPKAMANQVYLPKLYGRPQIIPAKLTTSGGRLLFVPEPKEMQQPSNKLVCTFMREHDTCGDNDGPWCYDMELDSGVDKQMGGCKTMLQYIWVHLGRASP